MFPVVKTTTNENQISFSATWNGVDRFGSQASTDDTALGRHNASRELKLSASQLIVACFCCLGAFELAVWAILKLWLFQP
jgi:hypothetical protein